MGWLDECKVAAAPVARLESLPCFVLAPRSSLSFSRDDFQTFFGECRSDGGKRQSGRKASPNTHAQGCRKNSLVFSNAECFVAKRANEKEKKLSSLSLSQLQTKANHASSADSVGWSSPRAPALVVIPASVEAS